MRLAILALILLSACQPVPPPSTPTPQPSPTPQPTATVVRLNYPALRNQLLTPLGGLIVAMREGSGVQFQVNEFEKAAKQVEPLIATDLSYNGNVLHSAIFNTRHAVSTKNLAELESVRLSLINDLK
jgi:hypothetical protein